MEKKVPCTTVSSQSDMQSKQTRCASIAARLHGAARAAVSYSTRTRSFISAILQTALNVKGYPHLPVSFHRRLSFEHNLSQKKITFSPLSFGGKFSCDNDRRETLAL